MPAAKLQTCLSIAFALLLAGGMTSPANAAFDAKNICSVFKYHPGWKSHAFRAERKWGTRVEAAMAVVFYESSYRRHVRPKKDSRFLFWKIKKNNGSSIGFAQATTPTWRQYQKEARRPFAKRSSFFYSMDFIGWYNSKSRKVLNLKATDVFSLYIAYHEGWSGFRSKRWRGKAIAKRAKQVADLAKLYKAQLPKCSWKRRREISRSKRR